MSSSDLQTYNVQDRILQDDEEGERQPIVGGGSGGKVGFLLRPWIQNWFVKEAICEAAATCLFVFIGAGAEFNTTVLTDIALAHGMAIMILISSTAKMSGGHLNPAVSFAALIMKQISLKKMLIYWAAQLIGGFLGGLLLMAATDPLTWNRLGAQTLSSGTNPAQGILWEFILTFILVFVVASVALRPLDHMGKHAPLTIGATVLACILAGSKSSGAAMNPARCFGPSLARSFAPPLPPQLWTYHYVYWVGPLLGAGLAGLFGRTMYVS